ncbi:alpha/beta hydrolase [Pendulispora brunnea]|uniref:Alpha/beta hydrolase n=1 Tax=Pendulispora brunnea TaxID=2905690 RepID=A0ABZ2KIW5_9BACT
MKALRFKHPWIVQESILRALAVDTAAHALAYLRFSMPDASPERFGVRVLRDIVYGPTRRREHRLDVYVPTRAMKPLPVILYVHGGGFATLSKETHYVMAMAFARRGYLVFNVNYRLGHKHPYPEPLEDVSEALLWVHRYAAEYGGDPDRIALAGESAGGNLVTALGIASAARLPETFARRIFDANIPLRAVVATYPILDLTEIEAMMARERLPLYIQRLLFDVGAAYLGPGAFDGSCEAVPLASPLLLLERGLVTLRRELAPFFLSVGTRDILLSHSKRMKAVLDRLGVKNELFIAPGEVHGFDAMVWRPAARQKWASLHSFLAPHMAA